MERLSLPVLLLLIPICLQAQIRLTSVDPVSQTIVIKNFGSNSVDISDYRLCSHLSYTTDLDTDTEVGLINGDFVLSADEEVTLQWNTSTGLDVDGRDLGLYLPGPPAVGFDDPQQMVDFMQYLGSYAVPSGRENVAAAKGIWTAGTFINANGPYAFTGGGNDLGATFWAGSSAACEITALATGSQSSCDSGTNTYSQEIVVSYSNAPASGNLMVNGQSFAISTSPQLVTLVGLVADESLVDVTASFSENPSCTFTEFDLFNAPADCTAPCGITDLSSGAQTACDPFTNTYTQEVTVSYQSNPLTGSLEVNGQFFPITGSPQTVTLTGLVADGKMVTTTARFTQDTLCVYTESDLFPAPEECTGSCDILALFAGAQSSCDTMTNTYTQEVIVAHINDPGSGSLIVNDQIFEITTSPQTVLLVDLPADGNPVDVTAMFSADSSCTIIDNGLFTAPQRCRHNQAPLAADDSFFTTMNVSVDLNILANDSDIDGAVDVGSVEIVDAAINGITEINSDGSVTYIPNLNFNGTDTFTYRVSDDEGTSSNPAVVTVNVDQVTSLLDPIRDNKLVDFKVLGDRVQINIDHFAIRNLSISIADINGKIIKQEEYLDQINAHYEIDLGKVGSTMFLVLVYTDQGIFSQKVLRNPY